VPLHVRLAAAAATTSRRALLWRCVATSSRSRASLAPVRSVGQQRRGRGGLLGHPWRLQVEGDHVSGATEVSRHLRDDMACKRRQGGRASKGAVKLVAHRLALPLLPPCQPEEAKLRGCWRQQCCRPHDRLDVRVEGPLPAQGLRGHDVRWQAHAEGTVGQHLDGQRRPAATLHV
jgi:hypothetical protein